ncbi:MAG: AlpA family transcriptional regulator [Deltaproteobacteria bacterium]|nr:AlpA family transcriptional regulator [Deltaproteobacteria bacterium]
MEESHSRILREPEVRHRTGLSGPTICRKEAEGGFPRRVKLGPRCVGWLESEIEEWVRGRVAARASGRRDRQRGNLGHRDRLGVES